MKKVLKYGASALFFAGAIGFGISVIEHKYDGEVFLASIIAVLLGVLVTSISMIMEKLGK